jgi:hypothetical protein
LDPYKFPLTNEYKKERFLGPGFNKPPLPMRKKDMVIDDETKERIIHIISGNKKKPQTVMAKNNRAKLM